MPLTYSKLRGLIGHKAGWAPSALYSDFSGDAKKVALCERILERGLSKFLDPPLMPGMRKHQWRFLKPTTTIDLVAGQYAYDLPLGFVEFTSDLIYAPGTSDFFPPIRLIGAEGVMRHLGRSDDQGRPRYGGVRVKSTHQLHMTQFELLVWPKSDAAYQVRAITKINPNVPGAEGDIPLGGMPHENTIIEACLSEAVAMLDDLGDSGASEERFMRFLQASIDHDLNTTAAQTFPKNLDPGLGDWQDFTASEFGLGVPQLKYLGRSDW